MVLIDVGSVCAVGEEMRVLFIDYWEGFWISAAHRSLRRESTSTVTAKMNV